MAPAADETMEIRRWRRKYYRVILVPGIFSATFFYDPTTSWPCKQSKTKIWLVQRFKPRRFENVWFFLIWPDSAAKPVLRSLEVDVPYNPTILQPTNLPYIPYNHTTVQCCHVLPLLDCRELRMNWRFFCFVFLSLSSWRREECWTPPNVTLGECTTIIAHPKLVFKVSSCPAKRTLRYWIFHMTGLSAKSRFLTHSLKPPQILNLASFFDCHSNDSRATLRITPSFFDKSSSHAYKACHGTPTNAKVAFLLWSKSLLKPSQPNPWTWLPPAMVDNLWTTCISASTRVLNAVC